MAHKLTVVPASDSGDLRAYFDAQAGCLARHGDDAARFLDRVAMIARHAGLTGRERVLDIGCGDGRYLLALADRIAAGLGVDLAPGMVGAAERRWASEGRPPHVRFAVDDAERLASLADQSFDLVFAVGVLEHVIDRAAALRAVARVLKPGGRFVCLTANGDAPLYRIAPRLGLETRRLSTDRHLRRRDLERLLYTAGFTEIDFAAWSFVPRDDMPGWLAGAASCLERFGRLTGHDALLGGRLARGVRGD